jgi:protein TilB
MIAMVPQLNKIDSKAISPSDRIEANQALEANRVLLQEFIENKRLNPSTEKKFTKEDRKQMFVEEMEEKRKQEEEEKKREKPKFEVTKKKGECSKFKFDGERRMCNEFKCQWTLEEYVDAEFSELRLDLPKFLDTSEIDVEITGKWVAVSARGDLFQMKLWEETFGNPVKLQRSAITGQLYVKLRKKKVDLVLKRKQELEEEDKQNQQRLQKQLKIKKEEEQEKERNFRQKQIKKVYGGFLDCDKNEESFDEEDLDDLEGLSLNSLESLD